MSACDILRLMLVLASNLSEQYNFMLPGYALRLLRQLLKDRSPLVSQEWWLLLRRGKGGMELYSGIAMDSIRKISRQVQGNKCTQYRGLELSRKTTAWNMSARYLVTMVTVPVFIKVEVRCQHQRTKKLVGSTAVRTHAHPPPLTSPSIHRSTHPDLSLIHI